MSVVSLHSFNGVICKINAESQFLYGNGRNVDTFEKLNRIGEGTYGVVCTLSFSFF